MQFRSVLLLNHCLDELLRLAKPSGQEIRLGQVVAIAIGRGIDLLRLFEKGPCIRDLSGLDIKLTQVMVGLEILRFQHERLSQLLRGKFSFS